MPYPVYAVVPSSKGSVVPIHGTLPIDDERHYEPVGIIENLLCGTDIQDYEMLRKDGYDVDFFVREVKANHGCRGALIMTAIPFDTWELAAATPGFVPMGHWTGAFYPPPKFGFNPNPTYPDDNYDGVAVVRCPIGAAYDNFEPPPYEEGGSYVMSLIPQGMIGQIIFLREDPLHVFATSSSETKERVVAAARECLKRSR